MNGLLHAYRQLWTNRELPVENNENETLMNAITKELLDEMTHPRLRKNIHFKFHSSVKRILSSSLNQDQKLGLIEIHLKVMENLTKNPT